MVHDWLVTYRGGEKVLEAILDLYPDADLFTLLHAPGALPASIESRTIRTSFLDRVPGIHRRYRYFLPLMPAAIQSLDLSGYERVVSSSHCVAKGVRIAPGALHLAYVHAPMRYMWDRFEDYFGPGRSSALARGVARAVRPHLQRWDRESSGRVHRLVANSANVAAKIERFWGRHASVVHPPVELERFASGPLPSGPGEYFLWVGAFAPYKRVDLVLEAFRQLGLPLWIAGSGQDEARVRAAAGPTVRLLGQVTDAELPELYRHARALVFAADEDFGITPLESLATGRPVIALGRGGALETVTAETGVFFPEQTAASLADAVRAFEARESSFNPAQARARASSFSPEAFRLALGREVEAMFQQLKSEGAA